MSSLHRSAHLASKAGQPPVQHAQRTLCRKLGIPAEDLHMLHYIDDVLSDFISMFTGPLPENIMAATSGVFDLDDEQAEEVTDALLHHADEAVGGLQEGAEARQA
ncbi:unnamed protein product [Urochloa humidicola]